MKRAQEVSSGGVLFRKTAQGPEIALVARAGETVWCLPKGHIDPGETQEEAALREVREETGLTGKLLDKIDSITYQYTIPEEKIRYDKRVHFYLMIHTGGSTDDHDFEVDTVEWVTLADALGRLNYPKEQQILRQAAAMIDDCS